MPTSDTAIAIGGPLNPTATRDVRPGRRRPGRDRRPVQRARLHTVAGHDVRVGGPSGAAGRDEAR